MTFITYFQNEQKFISTILTSKEIILNSDVIIYGAKNDDGYGYQRPIQKQHLNKIIKYITENPKDFMLPTSIVLAVNSKYADELVKSSNIDSLRESYGRIFRIVDGQHRIFAIASIIKDANANIDLKNKLIDFNFNVIILVINESRITTEMDVFIDINSKAKRLQTDLVNLAKYRAMKILHPNDNVSYEECIQFICMQTAYLLNNKLNDTDVKLNNPWLYGIKFELPNKDLGITSNGIISISSFTKSITGIVKLKYKKIHTTQHDMELIKALEDVAVEVYRILLISWNIVMNKWIGCFNIGGILYNNKYYLQKTMGTSAIHLVLYDIILSNQKKHNDHKNFEHEFSNIINNSPLTDDDWLSSGKFSGYTSESGFRKIADMIKNNI
ncbi:MAG: DGQHR domain-containing protein [Burkholderiales bacterium]|nr:DGQHR domain-containing protein [Burkholderiales bacterium]